MITYLLNKTASAAEQIEQPIHQTMQQSGIQIDLSMAIALAALILSVLSPFISSLLDGHYRIKEKKLDIMQENEKYRKQFYEEHRAKVVEHYIKAVSNRMTALTVESESDYIASMSEVLLYLDNPLQKYVFDINNGIDTNDNSVVISSLISLSKELQKDGLRK